MMGPHERSNEQQRRMPDHGADSTGAGDLDALRSAGHNFLRAGDEAIRRALSGDSEAFLRANRQRGGE
jgi:hypothetical protein